MPKTAKELTDLVTETIKAKRNLEKVLDFVDLVNSHSDEFPDEIHTVGEKIKEVAPEIMNNIEKIKSHINNELNKLDVDDEQAKDAANKLLLYHGDIFMTINWAETQMINHDENSYWWRYWDTVNKYLREQLEREGKNSRPNILK